MPKSTKLYAIIAIFSVTVCAFLYVIGITIFPQATAQDLVEPSASLLVPLCKDLHAASVAPQFYAAVQRYAEYDLVSEYVYGNNMLVKFKAIKTALGDMNCDNILSGAITSYSFGGSEFANRSMMNIDLKGEKGTVKLTLLKKNGTWLISGLVGNTYPFEGTTVEQESKKIYDKWISKGKPREYTYYEE